MLTFKKNFKFNIGSLDTGSFLSLNLKTWFPNLSVDVTTYNNSVIHSILKFTALLVYAVLPLQELHDKKSKKLIL